ncbi:MAG: preprotein translocase subunit SecG [Bacteroidales bacterium]|jgi:preprotein translocase subunit SecG|nr:preprotein translocase subunit SecG [Bacteroidales bacterium]MDD2263459.1 preprotein translocase subunit SecG [Bacteroidales bacterium]MDD2830751.1 preprotein translocase subunit SecG [Bacteroidales bacterium]MDD3207950.1 preprotein translocase subunit SecG [Bacteroidales bacterium]MDD3696543.1 preprotein translocase subunit SecG [Bacteroidales bacterium]
MYTVTAILIVIASILLTLVVLVQNSKGGGLAANFATGNTTFGVRQTADFLEKATWTLAIAILVLCLLGTTFISTGRNKKNSNLEQRLEQTQQPAGLPQFPSGTEDTKPLPPTE